MQLKIVLTVLAALVPLAVSTSVRTGSNSCNSEEFWWEDKSCCLPHGGSPNPPSPPQGKQCPPSSHYWKDAQSCCVPQHPPPPESPPPQCNNGWTWQPAIYACVRTPTPPTPPPSYPSGKPGNYNNNNNNNNHHRHKRTLKARATLCPSGLDACPVSGGDYECLDTTSELESCGGCTTLGKGQDCTAISDAWNVGCDRGSCIVYNCAGGFKIGPDNKSCVPL